MTELFLVTDQRATMRFGKPDLFHGLQRYKTGMVNKMLGMGMIR